MYQIHCEMVIDNYVKSNSYIFQFPFITGTQNGTFQLDYSNLKFALVEMNGSSYEVSDTYDYQVKIVSHGDVPRRYVVDLYQDNTVYDSVILNQSNSYSMKWPGLDGGHQYRAVLRDMTDENYIIARDSYEDVQHGAVIYIDPYIRQNGSTQLPEPGEPDPDIPPEPVVPDIP